MSFPTSEMFQFGVLLLVVFLVTLWNPTKSDDAMLEPRTPNQGESDVVPGKEPALWLHDFFKKIGGR